LINDARAGAASKKPTETSSAALGLGRLAVLSSKSEQTRAAQCEDLEAKRRVKVLRRELARRNISAGSLFSSMDANRDDQIDFSEFCAGIAVAGIRPVPSTKHLRSIFESFDIDDDSRISYAELQKALTTRRLRAKAGLDAETYRREKIREVREKAEKQRRERQAERERKKKEYEKELRMDSRLLEAHDGPTDGQEPDHSRHTLQNLSETLHSVEHSMAEKVAHLMDATGKMVRSAEEDIVKKSRQLESAIAEKMSHHHNVNDGEVRNAKVLKVTANSESLKSGKCLPERRETDLPTTAKPECSKEAEDDDQAKDDHSDFFEDDEDDGEDCGEEDDFEDDFEY
jgi:Ca2+-binding EF-hand superfamily protein